MLMMMMMMMMQPLASEQLRGLGGGRLLLGA
jgi:hypothetical protein